MKNRLLPIYHLTPAGYYQGQPENQPYQPATFAQEGFIHCTAGMDRLVKIANTYFAGLQDDLLALEIDPVRLTAPLVFELPISPRPAPPTGESVTIHPPNTLFPHIYGPLNRQAIVNCLILARDEAGRWGLPELVGQP